MAVSCDISGEFPRQITGNFPSRNRERLSREQGTSSSKQARMGGTSGPCPRHTPIPEFLRSASPKTHRTRIWAERRRSPRQAQGMGLPSAFRKGASAGGSFAAAGYADRVPRVPRETDDDFARGALPTGLVKTHDQGRRAIWRVRELHDASLHDAECAAPRGGLLGKARL